MVDDEFYSSIDIDGVSYRGFYGRPGCAALDHGHLGTSRITH